MNANDLAPIVLFVYNRPWHAEQTLNALMLNELASESILYIFADGPKTLATEEQLKNVAEVRRIIQSKKWCKEIIIKVSDVNKGLENSIIDGVTEVVESHGKVIVLEDDLVTSCFFLKFMNSALQYYKLRNSVFSISAYSSPSHLLPIPMDYKYDVYVSPRNSSEGWGTWKDRWNRVDWDMKDYNSFIEDKNIIEAFNRGGEDLSNALIAQKKGTINSWAIRFAFAHFINHAIAIFPCKSYINNIGFDGTGINTPIYNGFINNLEDAKSEINFLDILYQDKRIINLALSSFSTRKRNLFKKVINRIYTLIGRNKIFILKGKVYK